MAELVVICGSPRRGGNTDTLLERAADGARAAGLTVARISLGGLDIGPCRECAVPDARGRCRFLDGMETIYDAVDRADALLVGSPIFFGGITSQTKAMIDRFQCFWLARNITKSLPAPRRRPGAFLSVSASGREDFFAGAKFIVRHFFATTGFVYREEFFCGGLEGPAAAAARPDCMEGAYRLGGRIAARL